MDLRSQSASCWISEYLIYFSLLPFWIVSVMLVSGLVTLEYTPAIELNFIKIFPLFEKNNNT